MRKTLAVALLDCRRLGFGVVSAALVAGLGPSLASGLGLHGADTSATIILGWAFAFVGLAAGGSFGNDFADGRSSFFFARPLSAGVLIAGRFGALLALAASAFFSFMVSYWLSSRGREGFTFWVLTRVHAEALASCWAVSLFFGLATAARGRRTEAAGGMRAAVLIPLRLGLSFGAFLLMFGLFADLVLRAYRNDFTPIRVFVESWVVASFVASCVAITAGRTEPLRIARFQSNVMLAHFVLVSVSVVGAWTYVLHPGPEAFQRVEYPSFGSPDGRAAFVFTAVGRGDGKSFKPVFALDIASGQARRLNADPDQGPWTSDDGATLVWSEATPFFFRPLWRYVGGATTFRVRTSSGEVAVLPMPRNLPDFTRARDLSDFGGAVDRVLPAPDGDVFAILWDRHLTFTSRSRGELSDVNLGPGRPFVRAMAFLPSGELRAAVSRRDGSGPSVEFADIDPRSGSIRPVVSMKVENPARIQFDAPVARALLTSMTLRGRGASIILVDLNRAGGEPGSTVLLNDVFFPTAIFLADGRIAAGSGGSVRAWEKRTLRIFSPAGQMVGDTPLGEGLAPSLGGEMFPGVLGVRTGRFTEDLSLMEVASGAVVRRLPGFSALLSFFGSPPPPGTPAARLLQSADGKLYELPSVTAEPRLLLPLGRP